MPKQMKFHYYGPPKSSSKKWRDIVDPFQFNTEANGVQTQSREASRSVQGEMKVSAVKGHRPSHPAVSKRQTANESAGFSIPSQQNITTNKSTGLLRMPSNNTSNAAK